MFMIARVHPSSWALTCLAAQILNHTVQDLHGEGIIVSPRMMADHMPDYVTSVLGRLARDRRRQNPDFRESQGPAVGTGTEGTTGPSRSHMAIDIDSESDAEEGSEDEPELKRDR